MSRVLFSRFCAFFRAFLCVVLFMVGVCHNVMADVCSDIFSGYSAQEFSTYGMSISWSKVFSIDIKTTSANQEFKFVLGADISNGQYYMVVFSDASTRYVFGKRGIYSHKFTNPGTYTADFFILPSEYLVSYSSNSNIQYPSGGKPVISFACNSSIVSIGANSNITSMFPVLSGTVPSFKYLFYGCENLAGGIPETLFNFSTSNITFSTDMFVSAFENCPKLGNDSNGNAVKYVPKNLFSKMKASTVGSNMHHVFYGTNLPSGCPTGYYKVTTDYDHDNLWQTGVQTYQNSTYTNPILAVSCDSCPAGYTTSANNQQITCHSDIKFYPGQDAVFINTNYACLQGGASCPPAEAFTTDEQYSQWSIYAPDTSYITSGGASNDSYPFTLGSGGGVYLKSSFLPEGTKAPYKDNYDFLGWSTEENATSPNVTSSTQITPGMTLYAVWKDMAGHVSYCCDPNGCDTPDYTQVIDLESGEYLGTVDDTYVTVSWADFDTEACPDSDLDFIGWSCGDYHLYKGGTNNYFSVNRWQDLSCRPALPIVPCYGGTCNYTANNICQNSADTISIDDFCAALNINTSDCETLKTEYLGWCESTDDVKYNCASKEDRAVLQCSDILNTITTENLSRIFIRIAKYTAEYKCDENGPVVDTSLVPDNQYSNPLDSAHLCGTHRWICGQGGTTPWASSADANGIISCLASGNAVKILYLYNNQNCDEDDCTCSDDFHTRINNAMAGADVTDDICLGLCTDNQLKGAECNSDGLGNVVSLFTGSVPACNSYTAKKPGYELTGWYKYGDSPENLVGEPDESFSCPANSILNISVPHDKSEFRGIVLVGKWEPINFDIEYHNVDGVTNPNPDTYNITSNIKLLDLSKDDYIFKGWCPGELGCDNPQKSGDAPEIKNLTVADLDLETPENNTKHFYAVWEPASYTITYDLDGGNWRDGDAQHPTEYTIETPTFTIDTPVKNGYKFTGWCLSDETEEECSENTAHTEVDAETGEDVLVYERTVDPSSTTGDLTFNAQWEPIEYTIDYVLDEGNVDTANPESYTIETETFTLNNPTKDDYSFLGWCDETNSDCDTPSTAVEIATGSTGNRTFYAKWTVNACEANQWYDNAEHVCKSCPDEYPHSDVDAEHPQPAQTACYTTCEERPDYTVVPSGKIYYPNGATCEYTFNCVNNKWLHIGTGESDKICLYSDDPDNPAEKPVIRIHDGNELYYIPLTDDTNKKIHEGSTKKLHVSLGTKTYNAYDKSAD